MLIFLTGHVTVAVVSYFELCDFLGRCSSVKQQNKLVKDSITDVVNFILK